MCAYVMLCRKGLSIRPWTSARSNAASPSSVVAAAAAAIGGGGVL